ncbi:unnamed protein product [Diabrotica balteata]|uniref:MIP18 family-like domain-containing protein n=2 Tax=Diabrotica TaxID=50385 RepID=A0A9N9XIN1_DIABA|nr:unnamed protein product [Diabrotica balteata]
MYKVNDHFKVLDPRSGYLFKSDPEFVTEASKLVAAYSSDLSNEFLEQLHFIRKSIRTQLESAKSIYDAAKIIFIYFHCQNDFQSPIGVELEEEEVLAYQKYKLTSITVEKLFDIMSVGQLENQNPNVYKKSDDRTATLDEEDDTVVDEFDQREIFDLIRDINDPEHPLSLEQLHVVQENLISIDNGKNSILINFTPTIPHCSMATLIGLSIRVKLLRCLPSRFKVRVEVTPGTHNAEHQVNKQLADKERVAAALENSHLIKVINQCIASRNRG